MARSLLKLTQSSNLCSDQIQNLSVDFAKLCPFQESVFLDIFFKKVPFWGPSLNVHLGKWECW